MLNGIQKTKRDFIARELFDHETDPQENSNIANSTENEALITQLSKSLSKGFAF